MMKVTRGMRVQSPRTYGDSRMGTPLKDDTSETRELVRLATTGDEKATAALFEHYRERLKQMVRLRLDRQLQGHVDASDVLQDSYLEVSRRIDEYARNPELPVYLWIRALVGQKMVDLARRHLGARWHRGSGGVALSRRDAPGFVGLAGGSAPGADHFAQRGRGPCRDPDPESRRHSTAWSRSTARS